MTRLSFLLFFSMVSVLLEAILRSIGIFLPFTLCFVFYIAAVSSPLTGYLVGSLLGMSLDFLFGYSVPFSALTFPFGAWLSVLWLHHVKSDALLLHLGSGAVLGLLALFPVMESPFRDFPLLVTVVPGAALLLPFEILFLDMIRAKLGYELYADLRLNEGR